jgi:hypothetical protein
VRLLARGNLLSSHRRWGGCAMLPKEITPQHLRCGLGQCPGVFEHGRDELIIVGQLLEGNLKGQLAKRVGPGECAIRISRAMFAGLEGDFRGATAPKAHSSWRLFWRRHALRPPDWRGSHPATARHQKVKKIPHTERYFESPRRLSVYCRAFLHSLRVSVHAILGPASTR